MTGMAALSGLYAWQLEPFWLEFVKMKMPIKHLPDNLVGKTLMQISDIHVGKSFDYQFVIDSFAKAKEFSPDFVVYTGDFVTSNYGEIQLGDLEKVMSNAVKGRIETLGILGNHDYGLNWAQAEVANKISKIVFDNGVQLLRNESLEISGLNFIGMDDFWGLNFNPEKAMSGFDKSKANIVLCHNPDVCDLNIWGEYNSWILSGHTHGGQVKPPFLPPLMIPVANKNYTEGLFELSNNRTLYINRALGHLRQIRFNARPEITIFELQKA